MVDTAAAAAAGNTPAADADAATDSADASAVETEQLAQRWAWAPQGCIIYIQCNLRLVFVRWVVCATRLPSFHTNWKKKGKKKEIQRLRWIWET